MTTSIWVWIIIALVVIGGGVVITTQLGGQDDEAYMETAEGDVPSSFAGSMYGLLSLHKNITCTFERTDEQGSVDGTVYVSGEHVRGDFTLSTAEASFEGHMIRDEQYVYTWADTPFGQFASKIDYTKTDVDTLEEQAQTNYGLNDEADYNCVPWEVDQSKFVVPEDVEFSDMTSLITNVSAQGSLSSQCGSCDAIPDEGAKAQCKVALGC